MVYVTTAAERSAPRLRVRGCSPWATRIGGVWIHVQSRGCSRARRSPEPSQNTCRVGWCDGFARRNETTGPGAAHWMAAATGGGCGDGRMRTRKRVGNRMLAGRLVSPLVSALREVFIRGSSLRSSGVLPIRCSQGPPGQARRRLPTCAGPNGQCRMNGTNRK